MFPPEILTSAEAAAADRLTVLGGHRSLAQLVREAGNAVADAIGRRFTLQSVLILCGPGHNGDDGFAVATVLSRRGWPVTLAALPAGRSALAEVRTGWHGPVLPLEAAAAEGGLVIDALFGAGLARPLAGVPATVLQRFAAQGLPIVAVDLPSGVQGDTGAVQGHAAPAVLTVTFFRLKPAHLLRPGRDLCGTVELAQIGIEPSVLANLRPALRLGGPALFRPFWRPPGPEDHKYTRGAVLVRGGGRMTGAARLAARAARRAGAGHLVVAAPAAALPLYAADPGLLAEPVIPGLLAPHLARRTAVLVGPGSGTGAPIRAEVAQALAGPAGVVLDADALTAFAAAPGAFFDVLGAAPRTAILTPHAGEFARLFPDLDLRADRLAATRAAADRSGAVVLLKGSDTIVAEPYGRAALMPPAPAALATAGTGDVLAGVALALLGQGLPSWEAAIGAAWLQAAAAEACGPGLLAEDLPEAVPAALARLGALPAS